MAVTLGPVALKLGDEVLFRVRNNTTIKDLLEQLDKACKGGRIQDAEGFDVTAHYSQDLPEGEYAIAQPAAGGPIPAAPHLNAFREILHSHIFANMSRSAPWNTPCTGYRADTLIAELITLCQDETQCLLA